jgi:riboflavin synthase
MFTGIVEEIGRVEEIRQRSEGREIVVAARLVTEDAKRGDSICVDGVCLTAEAVTPLRFVAFASAETLARSTLGGLRGGAELNLERAVRVGDRLGGHLVQGHVDGVGKVAKLKRDGAGWTLAVDLPADLRAQMVAKGSIAIHGVSLTIATLEPAGVTIAVIPETFERTTLKQLKAGDRVNVEADVIGKYVALHVGRLLGQKGNEETKALGGGVTEELLRRTGFA